MKKQEKTSKEKAMEGLTEEQKIIFGILDSTPSYLFKTWQFMTNASKKITEQFKLNKE